MGDYLEKFSDFRYYFQSGFMSEPKLLVKHFTSQFYIRILEKSEVVVQLSFTTPNNKNAIFKNLTYHVTGRKEGNWKESPEPGFGLRDGFGSEFKKEYSFAHQHSNKCTIQCEKNCDLHIAKWVLTFKSTPSENIFEHLYSNCYLTITVLAGNNNYISIKEKEALLFLYESVPTKKKICISFFSQLKTSIRSHCYTLKFNEIDRGISDSIGFYSRREKSLMSVFDSLTCQISELKTLKDISYLNESELIGKALLFQKSMIMTSNSRFIKEEYFNEFIKTLKELAHPSAYWGNDVFYFAKLMLFFSGEHHEVQTVMPVDNKNVLTKSFFYISLVYEQAVKGINTKEYFSAFLNLKKELNDELKGMGELGSFYLVFSLCYSVLDYYERHAKDISEEQGFFIKKSLAYIIREQLREVCFAKYIDRQQFMCQPITFAKYLLNLVFFHAENIVKVYIPTQIRQRLYHSIEQENCHSLQTELAHLQHIIDIYIAGYTLLGDPASKFSHIITNSEDINISNTINAEYLLKGFSLAALSHDIGMLKDDDSNIAEASDYNALLNSGVLIQEEVNNLLKWFGKATPILSKHTFGSANYLLKATEQANADYEHSFTTDKRNILTPALKAIVYHATPQYSFKLTEQPVCAMLVLLDELFEWEHSLDARTVSDRASLVPLKLHLPVLPYTSYKSNIAYNRDNNTFTIKLIHGAQNSAIVHMEILRLAQMYGRFKYTEIEIHASSQFKIVINLENNDWQSIKSDITNAALNTESALRPLLLRWLKKQKLGSDSNNTNNEHQEPLELKYCEKPFANVDVKKFFAILEKYMFEKIEKKPLW